jgi:hypothetical protein
MKIALLIPCTSKGRPWKTINETYFYTLTFKTFLLTHDKEHEYHFYLGVDSDDPIFNNGKEQQKIQRFNTIYTNIHIHFMPLKVEKGYLTKMWNIIFLKAYQDSCDYFYQCGDDINFKTSGWINDSISILQQHNNIGLTGPINNNNFILTQAFVSRKHMEIFGYFFPENIINWGCDDWYNFVYKPDHFFPLSNHYCSNEGGTPRYVIDRKPGFTKQYKKNVDELRLRTQTQGTQDRIKIEKFINSIN